MRRYRYGCIKPKKDSQLSSYNTEGGGIVYMLQQPNTSNLILHLLFAVLLHTVPVWLQ